MLNVTDPASIESVLENSRNLVKLDITVNMQASLVIMLVRMKMMNYWNDIIKKPSSVFRLSKSGNAARYDEKALWCVSLLVLWLVPWEMQVANAAAKAGLIGFSKSLARELRPVVLLSNGGKGL